MFRKLGFLAVILLCSVAMVWAVPQTYKNRGPLAKSQVNLSEDVVANPSNLPPVGSRNPNTLDETIISENFDALANGTLPTGWTQVDVDGGYCAQFARNSTWQVYNYSAANAHSGTNVVMCHYNDAALPNNDWLILPSQNLSGTITLSYWAASQDADYLDSYEVKVSTAGAQPADFTHLIQSFTDVPAVWAQHTLDLSAYAGAPFYVAFHYNSIDEFALKIDDLLLEAGAAAPHGAIAGTVTDDETHVRVPGVTVEVVGTPLTTTTDESGQFSFNNVVPDTYSIAFSHAIYNSLTQNDVIVTVDNTTQVDVEMHALPLEFHDFTTTGGTVQIVDGDTVRKTLVINADYLIVDLDVTVNITHTYDSDLTVWLDSPSGQRVTLWEEVGGSGDNFVNTHLDDAAGTAISAGTAPFTGTFHPEGLLADYNGFSTEGTWTLVVFDGYDQDTGTINNFSIHVTSEIIDAVGNTNNGIPSGFAFHGNYPNPFNATTQFSFNLNRQSNVQLKLYNTLGQEVASLVNNVLEAGPHTVAFDATELTSGLYFARMSAAGLTETRKVILLK